MDDDVELNKRVVSAITTDMESSVFAISIIRNLVSKSQVSAQMLPPIRPALTLESGELRELAWSVIRNYNVVPLSIREENG
jgi:hypothetical protein